MVSFRIVIIVLPLVLIVLVITTYASIGIGFYLIIPCINVFFDNHGPIIDHEL
jgi:hypothetical protein